VICLFIHILTKIYCRYRNNKFLNNKIHNLLVLFNNNINQNFTVMWHISLNCYVGTCMLFKIWQKENNNETLTLILNCFCCQMNNNGMLLIAAHLYQVKNAGDCFWHHERILIASWICTTYTSNIHPTFWLEVMILL